ncbi:hypothetical protein ANCCEY_08020 [Ancylostoma ceylanicum]|uniref:Uncharacterized protein n=1 Tax=Ancylostoma ceylanicum TaxID=53326 RepID=A0A0D6LM29_9BILA|nr:hypothetical protein ANCCEY_08020 [Ancylostoma ceylanicum]
MFLKARFLEEDTHAKVVLDCISMDDGLDGAGANAEVCSSGGRCGAFRKACGSLVSDASETLRKEFIMFCYNFLKQDKRMPFHAVCSSGRFREMR